MSGLQYNEKTKVPGAQTERRGLAGPVRDLLRGETSPAAFFVAQRGSDVVGGLLSVLALSSKLRRRYQFTCKVVVTQALEAP